MTLVTKCYHVHFVPSSNYEPLDHKQNIKVQPQAAAEATIANSTLCQETHIHVSPLTSQFSCQLVLATCVHICYPSVTVHYQVFPGLYFCTQQKHASCVDHTINLVHSTTKKNKQKKDVVYAINCHLSFLLAWFLAILV